MRTIKGRVFASSNDRNTKVTSVYLKMALGYVKRMAEMGEDVVIVVDSLTRWVGGIQVQLSDRLRQDESGGWISAPRIPKKSSDLPEK